MFLTDLADVLRNYRAPDGSALTVVEVAGWKYRTYDSAGMSGNVGVVHHHTATNESAFAYSDAPTLSLCVNGRSDLPGPLANIVFGRSGTVYVIAGGEANHAGVGELPGVGYRNVGNYYFLGIEAESSGIRDDWTEAQRRVWPHLAAALDEGYSGGDIYFQIGHKEYSSEGKIDPAFTDMNQFRAEINTILQGGEITTEKVEELKMSVNEFLDAPIRDQKTGKTTTIRTEIGWLPQNIKHLSDQNAALPANILNAPIKRNGESAKGKPPTSLGLEVSYLADNFRLLFSGIDELKKLAADNTAKIDELTQKFDALAAPAEGLKK